MTRRRSCYSSPPSRMEVQGSHGDGGGSGSGSGSSDIYSNSVPVAVDVTKAS